MTTSPSYMVPAMKFAEELGVNRRTIDRWMKDEALDFPEPIIINGRVYFDRGKTEAFKRQRAATSHKKRQRVAGSTPSAAQQPAA